jgi:enoyl-CoA hydratase/carnithine racemase
MTTRDPNGQIRLEQRGNLLLMVIDRPEKRNGFTPKMFYELGEAYTRLETSADLFAGVLCAEGDHFSAGVDLPQMAELRKKGQPFVPLNLVDPCNLRPPLRKKPVVCAMQGICFTIAIELMLAADVAIAADNCRFAQLEVKRGIIPSCGATIRMTERAGWGNAMKWLLTGDEFDSAEAYRLGFVQEIVPLGQQRERALELAGRIAKQAPLAVQATIENARMALGQAWMVAAADSSARNNALLMTEDAAEGRASFAEKRDAVFVGR